MSKYIALFDIDRTIFNGFLIFLLADAQHKKGFISKDDLNQLYKDYRLYKKGILPYEAFVKEIFIHWAEALKGKAYEEILRHTKQLLKKNHKSFFPYFRLLIRALSSTHHIYFVTGEPQFVAEAVRDFFGITGFISSQYAVRERVFTGKPKYFLAEREEKQKAIAKIINKYGKRNSFAFGDSEGDIAMLESVQFPVCVNPTRGLKTVAVDNGWYVFTPSK